jgi:tRNA1(Val) A37 N6-methylase TrmN6
MDKMWILEIGIGTGIVGIFLFAYIIKIKSKLRKFILRNGGNE